MGIAQRTICVKFKGNQANQKRADALRESIKTGGDWLKVKRLERNLTPGCVADKMGIAAAIVLAWENNERMPDHQQQGKLAEILDISACDLALKFKSFSL